MVRDAFLVVGAAVVIVGCTAMQQQKSMSATAAAPPATSPAVPPSGSLFKNLQVLPQDITRDQLRATMRGYSRALGVHCDYCHAPGAGDAPDFPSDAKREKGMARLMIRMVRSVNHDYLVKVSENENSVNCWTCHRGHTEPETEPAPTPPPGAVPNPPAVPPAP